VERHEWISINIPTQCCFQLDLGSVCGARAHDKNPAWPLIELRLFMIASPALYQWPISLSFFAYWIHQELSGNLSVVWHFIHDLTTEGDWPHNATIHWETKGGFTVRVGPRPIWLGSNVRDQRLPPPDVECKSLVWGRRQVVDSDVGCQIRLTNNRKQTGSKEDYKSTLWLRGIGRGITTPTHTFTHLISRN